MAPVATTRSLCERWCCQYHGGDGNDSIRIDDAELLLLSSVVQVVTQLLSRSFRLYADLGTGNDSIQTEAGGATSIPAGAGTDTILFTNAPRSQQYLWRR